MEFFLDGEKVPATFIPTLSACLDNIIHGKIYGVIETLTKGTTGLIRYTFKIVYITADYNECAAIYNECRRWYPYREYNTVNFAYPCSINITPL